MKKVVIGLGFGDEGKGLVTDWLASKYPDQSVVRYSGGHQVGHCVRTKTDKHIFSNFGSGTLRGVPTFWNAKTVDPVGFCKEYKLLKEYNPKIRINPNCPVTTSLEKSLNAQNTQHGTMGVGFGATIEREEKHYHLYFQDLFHKKLLEAKFFKIAHHYLDDHNIDIENDEIISFFEACEAMIDIVDQSLKLTEDTIFESSQGLMLDMEYGIFPNVTRSKVGTQELSMNEKTEYYLVTRAYQTRHGNGWCSGHQLKLDALDETNIFNEMQGEFKTRLLDLDLIKYALTIDKKIRTADEQQKNLVITCLDHLTQSTGWVLTHNGIKKEFGSESEYVNYIIDELPKFNHVYVSHGPTAEDIVEVR